MSDINERRHAFVLPRDTKKLAHYALHASAFEVQLEDGADSLQTMRDLAEMILWCAQDTAPQLALQFDYSLRVSNEYGEVALQKTGYQLLRTVVMAGGEVVPYARVAKDIWGLTAADFKRQWSKTYRSRLATLQKRTNHQIEPLNVHIRTVKSEGIRIAAGKYIPMGPGSAQPKKGDVV